jgi:hypothetical protein
MVFVSYLHGHALSVENSGTSIDRIGIQMLGRVRSSFFLWFGAQKWERES